MNRSSVKYIILFLGLLFIVDFFYGKFLNRNFSKMNFGDFGEINRGLESNEEIFIIGSSRARHHYNPEILSQALNLSCYNAGIGGHGLFLNYAMLNARIKIKAPKLVILDLSPNVIVDKESYSKLNSLLPYYKKHESFKEIIELNPDFSRLEMISRMYIYNSTLYDLTRGYFLKSRDYNSGYAPLSGEINLENFAPFYLEDEVIDYNKTLVIDKIIKLCKANNIKLIAVISPTYKKFDKGNRVVNIIKDVFDNNNVEFYDYSGLHLESKYYVDQLHLNEFGANIFTNVLVENFK